MVSQKFLKLAKEEWETMAKDFPYMKRDYSKAEIQNMWKVRGAYMEEQEQKAVILDMYTNPCVRCGERDFRTRRHERACNKCYHEITEPLV